MAIADFFAICDAAAAYDIDHAGFMSHPHAAECETAILPFNACIALDVPIGSTIGDAARYILRVGAVDEAVVEGSVATRH